EIEEDRVRLAVAVARRIAPRQHDHHAPPRLRPGGVRALENGARAGEGVDPGARPPLVTVRAEVVGPQRVDRDEQDVVAVAGRGGGVRRRSSAVPAPQGGDGEAEGDDGRRPPPAPPLSIRPPPPPAPACPRVPRTA